MREKAEPAGAKCKYCNLVFPRKLAHSRCKSKKQASKCGTNLPTIPSKINKDE